MLTILKAIILGIIQGVTEWLPISSSGHLVLAEKLLGVQVPVAFDVFLHLGSLLVVIFVFRKDLWGLLYGICQRDKAAWTLGTQLVVASIPIGIVGFFFNDTIKLIYHSTTTVGVGLLFTGAILLASKKSWANHVRTWPKIIGIGFAQMFAILPGVSRSGMTISAGLAQGMHPEQAARFSFLLLIPALTGALILEGPKLAQVTNHAAVLVGVLTVIIVGYFSLKLLLHLVQQRKFHYFGWYCLAVGTIVLFSTIM